MGEGVFLKEVPPGRSCPLEVDAFGKKLSNGWGRLLEDQASTHARARNVGKFDKWSDSELHDTPKRPTHASINMRPTSWCLMIHQRYERRVRRPRVNRSASGLTWTP